MERRSSVREIRGFKSRHCHGPPQPGVKLVALSGCSSLQRALSAECAPLPWDAVGSLKEVGFMCLGGSTCLLHPPQLVVDIRYQLVIGWELARPQQPKKRAAGVGG